MNKVNVNVLKSADLHGCFDPLDVTIRILPWNMAILSRQKFPGMVGLSTIEVSNGKMIGLVAEDG